MRTKFIQNYIIFLFALILAACGGGTTTEDANTSSVISATETQTNSNPDNSIELVSVTTTNITTNSFDAQLTFNGDLNSDALIILYYCNQTDLPGCDPASGNSVIMGLDGENYVASVDNLSTPNDPGDVIKFAITASDNDGVSNSPLINIATLSSGSDSSNAISISGLSITTSSASFLTRVNYSGDGNNNASVALYYCNKTDDAYCNPYAGSEITMSRISGSYQANVTGLTSPNDPGDSLNVIVVASDSDGTDGSPLSSITNLDAAAEASEAGLSCGTAINSSGSYVLSQNYSCSGSWVTVNASDVTIDMAGYTVVYGTSTSSSHAITLDSNPTEFELKGNGVITAGSNASHAIYSNDDNLNGLNIHHTTLNMMTAAADAMRFRNSPARFMSVALHDNVINVNPLSAGNVSGIYFDGGNSAIYTGGIYNNVITMGTNASTGRPSAIAIVWPDGDSTYPLEIYSNDITLEGTYTNGVRLYGSSWLDIHDNNIVATTNADNNKPIQIDGGSSYNLVHSNNVDVNTHDTVSSTYSIRVRFGSSYNKIYLNTVNIEDSTGSYPAFGIAFGASESSVQNNGNEIYDNLIVGKNENIPVEFYEGSGNTSGNDFYNNTVINTGTGYCVKFFPVTSSTPVQNLRFSHESYTTSGTHIVNIPSYANAGSLSNVSWCGSNISGSQILDVNSGGGWSVSSSEVCTKP